MIFIGEHKRLVSGLSRWGDRESEASILFCESITTIQQFAFRAPYLQPTVITDLLFLVVSTHPPTQSIVPGSFQHLLSGLEIIMESAVKFSEEAMSEENEHATGIEG